MFLLKMAKKKSKKQRRKRINKILFWAGVAGVIISLTLSAIKILMNK